MSSTEKERGMYIDENSMKYKGICREKKFYIFTHVLNIDDVYNVRASIFNFSIINGPNPNSDL